MRQKRLSHAEYYSSTAGIMSIRSRINIRTGFELQAKNREFPLKSYTNKILFMCISCY